MTVPTHNEPQGHEDGTGPDLAPPISDETEDQADRPPYWEDLQKLPTSVHPLVEPVFKEWDQKVNQRFEQYAQRVNKYEPYNELIENYQPEQLNMAVQFAIALQQDPERVLRDLAEAQGYELDDEDLEGLEPDDPNSEKLQLMEQGLSHIIDRLDQTEQQQQEEAEEAEIWEFLEAVNEQHKDQYGDLDEKGLRMILTAAAADGDLEGAVQWYYDEVARPKNVNNNPQNTPHVLGAGGSLPSNNQDLSKLDKRQTTDLVVQMLQSQANANR